MKAKQKAKRNKALRHRPKFDESGTPREETQEGLGPLLREGLTEGLGKKAALERHPSIGQDPGQIIRHMKDDTQLGDRRMPRLHFVAAEDADSVWHDEPTGRLQKNVSLTFTKEVMGTIRAGMTCLRCLEPQDEPFPEVCQSPPEMGCTYPIRERQIMDVAMEFEGEKHLGPAQPISEYLAEQDERAERRRFEEEKDYGGKGIHVKEHVQQKLISPGAARARGVKAGEVRKKIELPPGVRSA